MIAESRQAFQAFLTRTRTWAPSDILEVLKEVRHYFRFSKSKSVRYFDVPCAFDIETTSFVDDEGYKTAIMYEWTFGIFGEVIIGRTWEEFVTMMNTLSKTLDLNEKKRLLVGVHNLEFEFQFLQHHFAWDKVFAVKERRPIYALTSTGIEFRCTYLLSGYKLETLADNLQTCDIKKLVGDLDYNIQRHSSTPLTEKELAYCVNDVKIVLAYLAELSDKEGGIAHIPLTKTGYVRRYCRRCCLPPARDSQEAKRARAKYQELMRGMQLDIDEYNQARAAFQGGFTHANPFYSDRLIEDAEGVTSWDFTSSYPYVMVSEQFPMSSGELLDFTGMKYQEKRTLINRSLRLYCCIFDVEIWGLQERVITENYLSRSRCAQVKNCIVNNGRVVSAEHLCTTLTEIDYQIMRKFYRWKRLRITNFRRYVKGYLPTPFVRAILQLYADKTTLKGVSGKEAEYLNSKEMLNSCYGMTVTAILRDEHPFTDHWLTDEEKEEPDEEKEIAKYNNDRERFMFYLWGVYVTAYARRNIMEGVIAFGDDYIYSDTDSLKVRHADVHMDFINKYNEGCRVKLAAAMEHHKLPFELVEPETIKGKKKLLGVYDFDGHYSRFKTLGAKRYMVQYSEDERNDEKKRGKLSLTVSGLNKSKVVPWLLSKGDASRAFQTFTKGMKVPGEHTGKLIHTYFDDTRKGVIVDYLGVPAYYEELSGVHLGPSDYRLSISQEYADFLAGLWEF